MESTQHSVSATSSDATSRALLRHLVATLAYRAAKVLRDAPPTFGDFSLTPTSRRPTEIVAHLGDLLDWALWMVKGEYVWKAAGSRGWTADIERFFAALSALDDALVAHGPHGQRAEMLIQGPLADALTHVGQLAMLRGASGAPVRPESYARAEIIAGRVGPDQAPARREFDGDASAVK